MTTSRAAAFVISLLMIAGRLLGQTPDVSRAAKAAVEAIRKDLRLSHIVIVPDSSGDSVLASSVANLLGASVRTPSEGRSCRGFVPQCSWRLRPQTSALRLRPVSVQPDSVTLMVEVWGDATTQRGPQSYYQRQVVYLALRKNQWVVTRQRLDFAT